MSDFVIRSQALNGFEETVVELGGDPRVLYDQLELPCAAELQRKEFIDYEIVIRLWNAAAATLDCPQFGYLVALKKDPRHQYGILSMITATSATGAEAISSFARYLKIHTKTGVVELRHDAGKSCLQNAILYPGKESVYQVYLHAIGLGINILRVLSEDSIKPVAIHLMFKEPAHSSRLRKAIRLPIFFNSSWNGLEFNTADLTRPLPRANTQLHQRLEQEISDSLTESRHDFAQRLRTLIGRTLDIGDPSIDRVSTYLACNKRTLQRRLEKWDLNFKQLLDQVRLHRAKHYLQHSSLSLIEIAELLSYNDQSSFSRFFSRCEGMAPLHWRQLQLEQTKED
ncbi:AraC family transcriptional regulator [Pseudomaricurvus alkylphenolicus]|uniref:AraC family transcriptional regulator ligand-binding domain-containing protein n=1 Tax=Pseudomaricurvus alkylphenolicus TaxID=1306991 RepID=UPI0014229F27|nr:AraC family transcriptional regulator [Pseudomaricurvus alkylphenolicus]